MSTYSEWVLIGKNVSVLSCSSDPADVSLKIAHTIPTRLHVPGSFPLKKRRPLLGRISSDNSLVDTYIYEMIQKQKEELPEIIPTKYSAAGIHSECKSFLRKLNLLGSTNQSTSSVASMGCSIQKQLFFIVCQLLCKSVATFIGETAPLHSFSSAALCLTNASKIRLICSFI